MPALVVGFRALGRALAGASGFAYSAIGLALCLSPPFFFLLGAISYVFALLLNWA